MCLLTGAVALVHIESASHHPLQSTTASSLLAPLAQRIGSVSYAVVLIQSFEVMEEWQLMVDGLSRDVLGLQGLPREPSGTPARVDFRGNVVVVTCEEQRVPNVGWMSFKPAHGRAASLKRPAGTALCGDMPDSASATHALYVKPCEGVKKVVGYAGRPGCMERVHSLGSLSQPVWAHGELSRSFGF